jgi:DNA helicase-2/ATP-dependent DNA helicase PcrA
VTGDPDQSIYGWRGADLNNILEFEHDYPDVTIVRLERNYRSTKRILRIADALIGHNLRRKKKALWTENDDGASVRLAAYADQDREAADIAEQIRAAVEAGRRKPSDFAIFYRVNALSRAVEKALRAAGVPYQMVRGQEFYARKEIKDVLAYCQLVNNPRDDMAFERTVNNPPRGIGRKTIERMTEYAYRYGRTLLEAARAASQIEGLPKGAAGKVAAYVAIIDRIAAIAHGDVEEVIGTVMDASGYRFSLAGSDDEQDQNRLANIEELLTDARQFDEQNPHGCGLEAYLERSWLVNDIDDWDSETDKATLMTLHAAKGLEFPAVFIVAVEDGVLPHERVGQHPDELEEERRLAFVGITRAKEELQLSYAVTRDYRGVRRRTIPSSFLMEIPREEMEIVDAASAFEHAFDPWEEIEDDDSGNDSWDWQIEDATSEPAGSRPQQKKAKPTVSVVAASIKTAATLSRESDTVDEADAAPKLPRVSPDAFKQGMTVTHPEYGPGKIIALSGSGKNRRATILFATVGQKKIILAHSPVRPAG